MTTELHQSVFRSIEDKKSLQKINAKRRILVSKKAWIARICVVTFGFMVVAINFNMGLQLDDPLIIYSDLLPLYGIMYLTVGWFFYKNPATGEVGNALVSVIVPVYNQKSMIEIVIDAIYESTYKNIEVIAINDGSKDGSKEILDSLQKKYPKLRVLHKENEGKRKAVAIAFYQARGDYMLLVDSDSVIERNAIAEIMKTFNGNPEVGAVVGFAKVWNAQKNLITKCQDVWYDYSFNIRKACESVFGLVMCCSGCLAGYRRETIAEYVPYWVRSKIHDSEDRELTSYVVASKWGKKELPRLYAELPPYTHKLMKDMARYDDAEDRGLTAQSILNWKAVYAASAIVYTDVPEKLKGFLRQQQRWKKGTTRVNFFVSTFFWRRNPVMATIFYLDFMMAFITPFILLTVFLYEPLLHHSMWIPITYLAGMQAIAIAHGLDYRFRDKNARNWKYKPLMNMLTAFVTSWLIFPALWNYKKNQWLTR